MRHALENLGNVNNGQASVNELNAMGKEHGNELSYVDEVIRRAQLRLENLSEGF